MLAIVSAYDLKYIELEDAIERISKTLETIHKKITDLGESL